MPRKRLGTESIILQTKSASAGLGPSVVLTPHDRYLFPLLLDANYLGYKEVVDLLALKVAHMLVGKTPAEIKEEFNISLPVRPNASEPSVLLDQPGMTPENAWVRAPSCPLLPALTWPVHQAFYPTTLADLHEP